MSDKKTAPVTIHARRTGLTIPGPTVAGGTPQGGILLYQGQTVTLSAEQVEATRDRMGNSWLDLTPEEQVRRWGMQIFGLGPAPEGLAFAGDDESYQYRAGLRAREYARAISDPAERAAALAKVREEYGEVLNPQAQPNGQHYPSKW